MAEKGTRGNILLIDSDDNITKLLRYNLTVEGFIAIVAKDASLVTDDIINNSRLIIIDAMEQKCSGVDFVCKVRNNDNFGCVPIIMCAHPDSENLAISVLNHGADDFIAKPFSLRELLARINALLRRFPDIPITDNMPRVADEIVIQHLDLRIDTDNRRVIKGVDIVPLTKTEFSILDFLIRHKNNYYTRDQIFSEIWREGAKANPRIVDTNISRMRKKLGDAAKIIVNRYGLGYTFNDAP